MPGSDELVRVQYVIFPSRDAAIAAGWTDAELGIWQRSPNSVACVEGWIALHPPQDICTPDGETNMNSVKLARQITLGRQYAELDHLLSQVNAAVKTAESIRERGVSAEFDVYTMVETIRMSRDLVRFAIDDTGRLIDEAGEDEQT